MRARISKKTIGVAFTTIFCILTAVILLTSCANFSSNNATTPSDWIGHEPNYPDSGRQEILQDAPGTGSSLSSAGANKRQIKNVVIFICFLDDGIKDVESSITSDFFGSFNGSSRSLKDYYAQVGNGNIVVDTIFPYRVLDDVQTYFLYQAPRNRLYYQNFGKETDSRFQAECQLLNAATNAADAHFNYNGVKLDGDGDGYVDSVSFILSGSFDRNDSSAWGGLLWPHSALLAELNKSYNDNKKAVLNGLEVNRFMLSFIGNESLGLVCHEFGHVLGMPDLYHYKHSTDYIPVGFWDIMHADQETPQFPLSYLREKYLRVLGDDQVRTIQKTGEYSLKPTTVASADDPLAYRVKINDNESIYFEYRNNSVSTYDSTLPGSGLIVYRVNSKAQGNENGKYQSTLFPDEVYVYRPDVKSGFQSLQDKEYEDLRYAFLSKDNEKFNTLGGLSLQGKYNSKAIYLTDGTNTGIAVTIEEQTDQSIRFFVNIANNGQQTVTDMRVEDTTIAWGDPLNIVLKLKFSGFTEYVTANPEDYTVVYNPSLIGKQTATVVYRDADGKESSCTFNLIIKDKIASETAIVTSEPLKRMYITGEHLDLTGLTLTAIYLSEITESATYSDKDKDKWTYEGFDSAVGGTYTVKVTYIPWDISAHIEVQVITNLVRIWVSERDTKTVMSNKETVSLTVMGVFEDGTERQLEPNEFKLKTLPNFASAYFGKKQILEVVSVENPTVSSRHDLYITDKIPLQTMKVTTLPSKTVYKYGESLKLNGGLLELIFADGWTVTVPMENYYSLFNNRYDALLKGRQSLGIAMYGAHCALEVTVMDGDSSLLAVKDETILVNLKSKYILIRPDTLLSDITEKLSSYLTVRFAYTDNNVSYIINERTHPSLLLNSKVKILLYNADKTVVTSLNVRILGDANGDGKANAEDVDGWLHSLMTGINKPELDMNGDGYFTLTDFAKLIDTFGGKNA